MKLFNRVVQPSPEMKQSVTAVERIVRYDFKNKRLLEEALTHPSITDSPSYERLEFLGDAALGLAISNHLFRTYPDIDQGHLSSLREANVSTEKFARVAVRLGLYSYLRRNLRALESLDHQVTEFTEAVNAEGPEGETLYVYGGSVEASKVLADIVESLAAAVYIDMNFDLDKLWKKFQPLLEPIVTPEELQGHPVTLLYKLYQKHGKQVVIKQQRDKTGKISTANVYVDGNLLASDSSEHKAIAKLNAARIALDKLSKDPKLVGTVNDPSYKVIAGNQAKQMLKELCDKKRLPQPGYKTTETASGKKFVSSVTIATLYGELCITGDEESSKLDAERSAASLMIYALQDLGNVINTKESDRVMGYVPSSVDSLWAMGCWVMRLSVFCLKGISLLVIFFVLVLYVIGFSHASYNNFC